MGLIQRSTSVETLANPSRLSSLANTGLLDSPIEEAFERLTRLAARTINTPISLVSLVDQERQFFKSAFGLPEPWLSKRETPLSSSFCKHVVATGKPLIIEDATQHPLVRNNIAVTALKVYAYAAMPLTLKDGQSIGSFCVIDHQPRKWTEQEIDILKDLSASVMSEIELRLTMKSKEELLDVILHDLNNPLSAILLNAQMMNKRAINVNDPLTSKMANTIFSGTERMKNIIRDLSDLHHLELGNLDLKFKEYDPRELINSSLTTIRLLAKQKNLDLNLKIVDTKLIYCDRDRIIQAISNLLSITVKRCKEGQTIDINLTEVENKLQFEIIDRGTPLTPEDIDHFFDRFVQTPALPNNGIKLSICLTHEIVLAHEGCIKVTTTNDGTNCVKVVLPYHQNL